MISPAPPADPRTWATRGASFLANRRPTRRGDGNTKDASAQIAVAAFAVYVGLALAGGGGRALSFTYPAGCLVVALFTYARSPSTYFAFTWWTWLLTPFIRRVFDLQYGFHPTSLLLLGPLLATTVAVFTVIQRRQMLGSSAHLPFVVAAAALAYAYLVGCLRISVPAASYDLLTWLSPLLFGLHIALSWRQFPRLRVSISRCVLWGLLVTSSYGIYQFIQPPLWDRAWVVNAELASVGMPLPYLIRVFSTLNAPGPYATMLVFALLIGIAAPQKWRSLPLALGLIALILTKGRSAWGAFFVGAVVIQFRQPLRSLPRQWLALLAVFLLAAPLVLQPRVLGVLSRRAATVSNLEQDHSYQTRVGFGRYVVSQLAQKPVGNGLGGAGGASKLVTGGKAGFSFDSGPLEIFSVMGWIGGSLFSMALLAIILPIVRGRKTRFEPVTSAAVGTVVALLAASLFGNVFSGVSGFFFWSAVGIATAGRSYATAADIALRFDNHPGLPTRALPLDARQSPAA